MKTEEQIVNHDANAVDSSDSDYIRGYDEEYLQSCIRATGDRFKGITDVNAYIAEIRGLI